MKNLCEFRLYKGGVTSTEVNLLDEIFFVFGYVLFLEVEEQLMEGSLEL
jgi:hypothetical protein